MKPHKTEIPLIVIVFGSLFGFIGLIFVIAKLPHTTTPEPVVTQFKSYYQQLYPTKTTMLSQTHDLTSDTMVFTTQSSSAEVQQWYAQTYVEKYWHKGTYDGISDIPSSIFLRWLRLDDCYWLSIDVQFAESTNVYTQTVHLNKRSCRKWR
ncbi:MAG: hypothetical protein KAX40_08700 [Herpetosiphon sp.]|nr:hypothetical protein [Herpetosiphon sp.]